MDRDGASDPQRIPSAAVERLLARAAELDAVDASAVSVDELRSAAVDAGIKSQAFDAALRELGRKPALGESGLPSTSTSRPGRSAVPAWVRLCLLGVPDRRAAIVFYWVFAVAMCAGLLLPLTEVPLPRFAAFGLGAFCFFGLWSTSSAVRWLDRHGWDLLHV